MDIREIMEAGRITVDVQTGPELRGVDVRGRPWEHYAYTFALELAGERLLSGAPYVAGTGLEAPADPADIFGAVVSDVQSVAPYLETAEEMDRNVDAQTRQNVAPGFAPAGWEEWATDMGAEWTSPAGAVESMRAFQEIAARAAVLRDRLPADVWVALLELEQ